MLARAWHALSDHDQDGIRFGSPACDCTTIAARVRQVLDWFAAEPPEPDGLGAVVVNPVTDKVWVRSAHPALPWHDPTVDASEQWSDPTSEAWYVWADLPRPLVVLTPGWTPPTTPQPRRYVPEPTGIGAVVVDTADDTWVRVHNRNRPWRKSDPDDTGVEHVANWDDLDQPVAIRSHGWEPPTTH